MAEPTSRQPTFSLVIPCYNEAKSLPELLLRARFTAEAGDGEVVLVDNGSTDDTPAVLARLLESGDDRVRSIEARIAAVPAPVLAAGAARAGVATAGLAAIAAAAALLLLPAAVPLLVFSPPPLVVRHRNQLLLQRDKGRHERRSALHHLFRI